MKVKKVIEQIEHIFGRQPEGYMIQLINDALLDISSTDTNISITPQSKDTDNLFAEADVIESEVEEMLDQWDYTWFNFDDIDTTDTGGTV